MIRRLAQPGPVGACRHSVARCDAQSHIWRLEAGMPLLEAIDHALARSGAEGAYLRLRDTRAADLAYVIPAHSPDDDHVAWYSPTHRFDEPGMIVDAGLFVGKRMGETFIHCHGLWRMGNGALRMGHLLSHETVLGQPVDAHVHALHGARLETRDDAETNFHIFAPIAAGRACGTGSRALLCTIRPNQDIGEAIEAICREAGIGDAAIMGIGSLVGGAFDDGRTIGSHATEVLIEDGALVGGSCRLDIAMVGIDGAVHRGRLAPGRNGVCITFELLILPAA